MQEKENILRILEETKQSIKLDKPSKLKELSDQTVHTSSITQDPDNITIAVLVYSLSKILERRSINDSYKWERFCKKVISEIDNIIFFLKKENDFQIKNSLTNLRQLIENFSGKVNIYIQDVFRKAQINKASKLYEHGISMGQTAKLLGITLFELTNYASQKVDSPFSPLNQTITLKSRIKLASDFFK